MIEFLFVVNYVVKNVSLSEKNIIFILSASVSVSWKVHVRFIYP